MPHFPSEPDAPSAQPLHSNNPESSRSETHDETETSPTQRIRVKNRRNRYLELHPEYFSDPNLEIAEPLLYDRLIHRFKTSQEREIAGKARLASSSNNPSISAFAHILESNLTRSEAKLHAVQHPDPSNPMSYTRTPAGEILERELDPEEPEVANRAEGWARWCELLRRRFVRGGDVEFEYEGVDGDEGLDFWEERERGEAWVEGEGEEFVGDFEVGPRGETGVQDF